MAQQSSGEFASTNPTTRTQDAGFQEPGFSPEISLNLCSCLQQLQRSRSSHFSKNAPGLSGVGDADLARSCRCGVRLTCPQNCCAPKFGNVTKPGLLLLPDSKTGRKTIVLNAPAMEILSKLTRIGEYVIVSESAGTDDEKPRSDLSGLGQWYHATRDWMAYGFTICVTPMRATAQAVG
jgi:hypothetical protein